jgi:hypothetical protein
MLVLYGRWLRLVGNYWLNRAHGIPVGGAGSGMLDPEAADE